MDQSPDRQTTQTKRAGHRYKAVFALTLVAAAAALFAYVQPESTPANAANSSPDCNAVIALTEVWPDCSPLPAIAAIPKTADDAIGETDYSAADFTERPVPSDRVTTSGEANQPTGNKTAEWHAPNNYAVAADMQPRAGYTMAELCAARGNDSQLYCATVDAPSHVNKRRTALFESAPETYTIAGRVLTAEGSAVGGITVMASPERLNDWEKSASSETLRFWTRTDSLGAYTFEGLPEGEYSIRVSKQTPYRPARIIARSGVDYADLVVNRDSELMVEGQVLADDSQPLEGVTVLPVLLGQPSVLTDDNGRFALPVSLDPNTRAFSLRFQRPGYREESAKVAVGAAPSGSYPLVQVTDINQVMRPVEAWTSLRGTVNDTSGKSMGDRAVELRPLKAKQTYRTTTDRNGQFEFPVLEAPADYRLIVAGGTGYKDFRQIVRLTANNPELPVVLEPYQFGKVSGRLVNTNGEPVADFDLLLRNAESTQPNAVVRTDRSGSFTVESAPAGSFVLASQSVPAMLVKGLHLEPGESLHLPLALDWGAHQIRGTVLDAMNNPVPASRVVLQWSQQQDGITTNATRRTAADAQGHFRFSDLGPGPHLLRVDAPGYAPVAINHDLARQGYEVTVRLN